MTVVYESRHQITVNNVSEPKIKDPRDATLKVTSITYGSDLYTSDGQIHNESMVFCHKIKVVLIEIEDGVSLLKKGKRVFFSFPTSYGCCIKWTNKYINACLKSSKWPHTAYKFEKKDPFHESPARFLRLPYHDIKLPEKRRMGITCRPNNRCLVNQSTARLKVA